MARTATVIGGGTVELEPAAFEATFNMPLVHEAVRAEFAARRQGTHSTKTRGQVSGGGAKPWRQKGTGRARAGSSRSPVWTGGGTVFGPSPRSYTFKVNRKARRAALRSALSVHAERGSLAVFDATHVRRAVDEPRVRICSPIGTSARPVLVLLDEDEAQRRPVVPQPQTRHRDARCRCRRRRHHRRPRRCSSPQAAMPSIVARAPGTVGAGSVAVGEESD